MQLPATPLTKCSLQVAERLGVTSLRRQMLAQSADIMQLGLSSAEAFGQSEALTTRLKHIIDAYPDGPGILMELIQNADDAGGCDSLCMYLPSVHAQARRQT